MNALSAESIKVKIMDRDYVFACAPDEKETLLRCIALVDEKMNAIKNMGKLTQIDRIAVMAALMMASDLVAQEGQLSKSGDVLCTEPASVAYDESRLDQLQKKLDQYLTKLKPQLRIDGKDLFA